MALTVNLLNMVKWGGLNAVPTHVFLEVGR